MRQTCDHGLKHGKYPLYKRIASRIWASCSLPDPRNLDHFHQYLFAWNALAPLFLKSYHCNYDLVIIYTVGVSFVDRVRLSQILWIRRSFLDMLIDAIKHLASSTYWKICVVLLNKLCIAYNESRITTLVEALRLFKSKCKWKIWYHHEWFNTIHNWTTNNIFNPDLYLLQDVYDL